MPNPKSSAAVLSLLVLTACGGARTVVNEPSGIRLDQALIDAVDAIHKARAYSRTLSESNVPLGLNICSLQAVFNVTAGGTDRSGLVLNVGAPAGTPVVAGVQLSSEQTLTAQRGNTVTVNFTSPACNPPDTLGTARPADVALLQRQTALAREGIYSPVDAQQRPTRPRDVSPDARPADQRETPNDTQSTLRVPGDNIQY